MPFWNVLYDPEAKLASYSGITAIYYICVFKILGLDKF